MELTDMVNSHGNFYYQTIGSNQVFIVSHLLLHQIAPNVLGFVYKSVHLVGVELMQSMVDNIQLAIFPVSENLHHKMRMIIESKTKEHTNYHHPLHHIFLSEMTGKPSTSDDNVKISIIRQE